MRKSHRSATIWRGEHGIRGFKHLVAGPGPIAVTTSYREDLVHPGITAGIRFRKRSRSEIMAEGSTGSQRWNLLDDMGGTVPEPSVRRLDRDRPRSSEAQGRRPVPRHDLAALKSQSGTTVEDNAAQTLAFELAFRNRHDASFAVGRASNHVRRELACNAIKKICLVLISDMTLSPNAGRSCSLLIFT